MGGGSGTAVLTITLRRGQQQIAPEGIAFFAEATGFDAQKPADGSVYDPTMHEISYTWSFGDPGQFGAPQNLLAEWKNRNIGYGPYPAHVFTTPGTYVVTCTAHEPASGKTATASAQVIVADPQAVFTATTTVICAATGDFSGAPAHDATNRTTTFADAITLLKALKKSQPGELCRLLFRGGNAFTMAANTFVGRDFHNCYVSTFGTGRATIRATANGTVFQIWDNLPVSGASISGIDFLGPWDSTTETVDPAYPAGAKRPGAVSVEGGTVHDCTASCMGTAFGVGKVQGAVAIFNDCAATNWEDYGAYVSGNAIDGYVAFLGPRFAQHPQALQGGNGKSTTSLGNRYGAMRFHGSKYLYVDAADLFPRNGWTVVAGVPVDQNCIRDHRNDPG